MLITDADSSVNTTTEIVALDPEMLASLITSDDRIQGLLTEVTTQLDTLQPQIESLERAADQLKVLRREKQKLLSLKLSLEGIVGNYGTDEAPIHPTTSIDSALPSLPNRFGFEVESTSDFQAIFRPDKALEVGYQVVRKGSLNAHLYAAVVYHGGKATTEAIKQYLIEQGLTQPASGESFEAMPLTEISSRANYLVRKQLLESNGRGAFRCLAGWVSSV